MRRHLAGAAVLLAAATLCAEPPSVLGTWRGTSTCVDKEHHPACKDEVVIYEFRPSKAKAGAVELNADKVVNGERLSMGALEFTFDAKATAWTSEFQNAHVHALWSFTVEGDRIEGTLVDLPGRALVRRVAVARAPAP